MFNATDYDALYAILGLTPGASESDIKATHRALAKRNHSDKFTDEKQKKAADERLAKINNAKDELLKYWKTYKCAPPSRSSRQAHEHSTYHGGAHGHTSGPNHWHPWEHGFHNAGYHHGTGSFNDPWEEFEQKFRAYTLAEQIELIRQFIHQTNEVLKAKQQRENAEAQAQKAKWNAWDQQQKEEQKKAQEQKRKDKLKEWTRIILIFGVIFAVIAALNHPHKKPQPAPMGSNNIYQSTESRKVEPVSPNRDTDPKDKAPIAVSAPTLPPLVTPATAPEREGSSNMTPATPKSKKRGKHHQ